MMDDAIDMIEDCETRSDRLGDWECDFIDSIRRQVDEGKSLTQTQYEKLEEVWQRATERG